MVSRVYRECSTVIAGIAGPDAIVTSSDGLCIDGYSEAGSQIVLDNLRHESTEEFSNTLIHSRYQRNIEPSVSLHHCGGS